MANVAINGFDRIGRAVFKLMAETPELHVVAINDLPPPENLAYLLQYDTVYGRYSYPVHVEGDTLAVNGNSYQLGSEQNSTKLPWRGLGVDLVFERTGVFNKREDLYKHAQARNTSSSPPRRRARTYQRSSMALIRRTEGLKSSPAPVAQLTALRQSLK